MNLCHRSVVIVETSGITVQPGEPNNSSPKHRPKSRTLLNLLQVLRSCRILGSHTVQLKESEASPDPNSIVYNHVCEGIVTKILTSWNAMIVPTLTPKIPSVFLTNFCSFDLLGRIHFSTKKSMRT
jgi:hypothetical protein